MVELDGGGSGGSTDDSTSTGDDSTLSNFSALNSLGIGWIIQYEEVLKAFGKRPVQFISGAILTIILGGIEEMVIELLDAILALGDAVAAVLTLVASVLTDAGSEAGMAIIGMIRAVNEPLLAAAQAAGPLAPLVGTAIVVGEIIIVVWVGQLAIRVILDIVPGLGGLV